MGKIYCGNTDAGFNFSADKPFVLLGWPAKTDAKTFDTEDEARRFIAGIKGKEPFVRFAQLYSFYGKKWNSLP
jgi:hypothetical protein